MTSQLFVLGDVKNNGHSSALWRHSIVWRLSGDKQFETNIKTSGDLGDLWDAEADAAAMMLGGGQGGGIMMR